MACPIGERDGMSVPQPMWHFTHFPLLAVPFLLLSDVFLRLARG